MNLNENEPELVFVHQKMTPELAVFISGFWAVIKGEEQQEFRTAELAKTYQEYMRNGGGLVDIRTKMNGSKREFVENIFPYDAIMPRENNHLVHLCLFSVEGELPKEQIEEMIRTQYGEQAAFVFVHNAGTRTVKEVWHAHVIVDLACGI